MNKENRLFHMEAAGSMTPALEGAPCSARHGGERAGKRPSPAQQKAGAAPRRNEATLERR